MFIRSVPDSIELLGFFESDPVTENKQDLHFSYRYTDVSNVTVVLSYCEVAGWVQVVLEFQGREMSRFLCECVSCFEIRRDGVGEILSAKVMFGGMRHDFSLRVKPFVSFNCSNLEM